MTAANNIVEALPRFQRAELIKWYSYYQEQVIADSGFGIILDISDDYYEYCKIYMYKVYMLKERRFAWFSECDIDPMASK